MKTHATVLKRKKAGFAFRKFRGYAKATEGGGATVESTSSGGGSTRTTTSGGGTTETTTSGGGTVTSTNSGGGTSVTSAQNSPFATLQFDSGLDQDGSPAPSGRHFHTITVPTSTLNHSHSVSIPNHSHSVSIPSHDHSVTIPNHSHNVTIPSHTHDITLPDHVHDIQHGIYKLNTMPSNVTIEVDGNPVPFSGTSADELDLIPYLAKDSDGKILRGQWHEVTLTPDTLCRVNANIISRMFIQSDLGGKY
ncbi:hypothetical protein [Gracilibacillus salinarum]|uniref:Uncharacterized protein n=1 Tax=Gracilibacillus salinarum TaxID=2932255 RepID=A0ABY4GPQ4_9BACI|nr:hypothetical protein [Gracilibacillus salinarum]UOQ86196.1 hypothetical protein MUN87_04675 [Gracilibacillus salinarum]